MIFFTNRHHVYVWSIQAKPDILLLVYSHWSRQAAEFCTCFFSLFCSGMWLCLTPDLHISGILLFICIFTKDWTWWVNSRQITVPSHSNIVFTACLVCWWGTPYRGAWGWTPSPGSAGCPSSPPGPSASFPGFQHCPAASPPTRSGPKKRVNENKCWIKCVH